MNLSYRKLGTGDPLIIMHGLFGSGDNWYSVARELSVKYTIYLVDARNHGNSPHYPEHNYTVLTGDIHNFMVQHGITNAILIGHSMGGKTALNFGMQHPEKIKKMVVVDISPLGYDSNDSIIYNSEQMAIIRTLMTIDTKLLNSRTEADKELVKTIPSAMVRQFLLKNLKRSKEGKFHWSLNLQALHDHMPGIFEGIIKEGVTDPRGIPEFPLLFIKGERSGYIGDHDVAAIRHYFPWAEIKVIPKAGHWLHAEQPELFLKEVREFL
jgi:pimeloyl-ACP methyl ester carboxylesterase